MREAASRSFCQPALPFTLNARALALYLLRSLEANGVRAALERFDWRATTALRKKQRKSWDAIKQLIRYQDVVGGAVPILGQSLDGGELFRDESAAPDEQSTHAKD